MATYTASAAQTGVQPKSLRVGTVNVKSVYSFDGISSSVSTIVNMVKVAQGARVTFMEFFPNVAGEYTLEIGDNVNGQRYRSNATTSAGVGTQRPLSLAMTSYQYSADDVIIMKISLASVLTLGGAFYMNVGFTMDA